MKFTIEKVVKLTGISAVNLRNWEKRYGFPCPQRANSGHRFYEKDDIEFLKRVKEFLNSGYNLSEIGELYRQNRCDDKNIKAYSQEIVDDVDYRVQLLCDSLVQFDSTAALGHYNILNAKLSPDKFFDRVIEAAIRRLGEALLRQKITVAQEHFAASFFRMRLMSFLCLDLPAAQPIKVLAAHLGRDKHEAGILLVSAHLKLKGYAVNYFGPDLAMQELLELLSAVKPHCLLLSYFDSKRFLHDLKSLQQLKLTIGIGGAAFADAQFYEKCLKKIPKNIFICNKALGSEAATFVEMICQSN